VGRKFGFLSLPFNFYLHCYSSERKISFGSSLLVPMLLDACFEHHAPLPSFVKFHPNSRFCEN
jgi:hypothetical protein